MKQPNVMLIILDATRADCCSCYGAEQLTTPILDQLAAEGTLFEQAISPAPWTLPAISSLFTGLFPSQTGIYQKRKLAFDYPTLAELLAQHGYATFGITNNSWLSANFGLQRGFDRFHKQWQLFQTEDEINRLVMTEEVRKGQSSWRSRLEHLGHGNLLKNMANAAFIRWFAYRQDLGAKRILKPLTRWVERQEQPWFAMVHYLEAHLPYKSPLSWVAQFSSDLSLAKKMLKADHWRMMWRHLAGVELMSEAELRVWQTLYLAGVAYQDHHLGLLVDCLRQRKLLDDTLLIVVADHGESLGEHGLLNHQYSLYDALIRVPLVIRYPNSFPAGVRVSEPVQSLDIFQTILDVVGIEGVTTASKSLLPSQERRRFTISEYGAPHTPQLDMLARYGLQPEHLTRFERGLTALRTKTHKLILGTDGSVELYLWQDDPQEENNLANDYPAIVRQLRTELDNWQAEHQNEFPHDEQEQEIEIEMDSQIEARLQALGYLE